MKAKRHGKMLEIIRKMNVQTQEELSEHLRMEGFHVTQATISRDIRELKLTKMSVKGGGQKYVALDTSLDNISEKLVRIFKEGFLSADMAQNIIVLKTMSGMAMAVAAALDSMEWDEVLGSIAGDDTVISIVRTTDGAVKLIDQLKQIAEE